jgi:hypothetical protein
VLFKEANVILHPLLSGSLFIKPIRWAGLHKIASAWLIFALLAGNFSAILEQFAKEQTYRLTRESAALLGHNTNLADKLAFDNKSDAYRFNADAVDTANKNLSSSSPSASADPATGGVPEEVKAQLAMQQNVGASDKKDKQLYGVDLPVNPNKGITVADTNTKLSFTMTPNFPLNEARVVNNRVVYPVIGTDQQAVYSLKNNGLKEDIVLQSSPSSNGTLEYSYTLKLPDTLVAKLMPNGAVGIYSADPALFGQITASSPDDQQLIDNARKTAEKNYLVFAMPAPVIKQAGSDRPVTSSTSHFTLNGDQLSVSVTGLNNLNYPVSVDPSVVVTSTADFQLGNNEDNNIDFTTTGQINRDGLTGGTTAAWTATAGFSAVGSGIRYGATSVAYNGYVYVMGGNGSGYYSDALFAPINSNGTLGAWTATTGFSGVGSGGRNGATSVVYNGYVYIMGGYNGGYLSDTLYAPINSNGTLGSWTVASNFSGVGSGARFAASTVVYNGYVYIMGGYNGSYLSDTIYSKINADGTLGAWVATTNFSAVGSGIRDYHTSVVYNGYVYVMGGSNGSSLSDSLYAPVNADGTLGAWTATTGFSGVGSGARYAATSVVSGGYVYVMGGYNGGYLSDTLYAQINANGAIGTWAVTAGFSAVGSGARYLAASVTYNGYIYIMSGNNGANLADTMYAKINPAAVLGDGTWPTTTSFTTARYATASVVNNGFLYITGGFDTSSSYYNSVQYSPINADGTVGVFTATNTFTTPRDGHTAIAYNGYLYIIGGYNGTYQSSVQYALFCTGSNSGSGGCGATAGTVGTWAATTAITTARYLHTSVVYNGYLYVVGGTNGTMQSGVNYALVCTGTNSGSGGCGATAGTLGTWFATTNFTNPRDDHTSIVANGYLYVIGGQIASSSTACKDSGTSIYCNDTQYALICTATNSGSGGCTGTPGTVGTWTASANYFATPRHAHTSVLYNGYVYVLGGHNGSYFNDVQYAPLNTNGSVGVWAATTSFTTAREYHNSVVNNGYVYVIGGINISNFATVQYERINNGGSGTLGTWTSTNAFNISSGARSSHTTVVYNGYIYVMGGTNGSRLSDVLYAPINAGGTVGWTSGSPCGTAWCTTTSLSTARSAQSSVVYNGYVYVMGGIDTSNNRLSDVVYAKFNSDGTLAAWNSTNGFSGVGSGARATQSSVVYKGYVYLIGGLAGGSVRLSDVLYAPVNSDATVGWASGSPCGTAWCTTTSLPNALSESTAVLYGGYVYMMGGINSAASYVPDTIYAPLNSNGTVGSWLVTTSLPTARAGSGSFAANGYMYIVGGTNAVAFSDSYSAPINSNGNLGSWSGGPSMSTVRSYFGLVAYNGYSYATGGGGAGFTSSVEYASINSQPRVASYSKLVDLGSSSNLTSLVYNGTLLGGGAVKVSWASAATSTFGATTTVNNVTPGTTVALSGIGRYVWIKFTLDDSTAGTFADIVAGQSFITDITLNYTAAYGNPATRLRGGAFFSGGVLQRLNP